MLRQSRFGQFWIIALALTLASPAWGGESAPMPVEPGQFYVGGAYGKTQLKGPSWKSQIQYKDNSAFTSDGLITVTDPEGYLVGNRFENERWIPEVYLGYSFGENKYGGGFRIEASGSYYDRESGASIAGPLTSPTDGFFIDDDSVPPQQVEVGLFHSFLAIDGKDNVDGSNGGFLTQRPIQDVELRYAEENIGVDVTLYYDNAWGDWLLTRGFSLSYTHVEQTMSNVFDVPSLSPWLGGDTMQEYRYQLVSNSVGVRLFFSVGKELFTPMVTAFANGSARLMGQGTGLEGYQRGPCLATCNLNPGSLDYSVGEREMKKDDWGFRYDIELGGGLSFKLWLLRLTAEGGGTKADGYAMPREEQGEVVVGRSSGHWGWYFRGRAGVAF